MKPRKIRIDEIEQVIRLTLDLRGDLNLEGVKSFLRWQKELWYAVGGVVVPDGPITTMFSAGDDEYKITHALHNDWPVVVVNRVRGKTLILVNSPVALEGIALATWSFNPIKLRESLGTPMSHEHEDYFRRKVMEGLNVPPHLLGPGGNVVPRQSVDELKPGTFQRGKAKTIKYESLEETLGHPCLRELKEKLRAGGVHIPDGLDLRDELEKDLKPLIGQPLTKDLVAEAESKIKRKLQDAAESDFMERWAEAVSNMPNPLVKAFDLDEDHEVQAKIREKQRQLSHGKELAHDTSFPWDRIRDNPGAMERYLRDRLVGEEGPNGKIVDVNWSDSLDVTVMLKDRSFDQVVITEADLQTFPRQLSFINRVRSILRRQGFLKSGRLVDRLLGVLTRYNGVVRARRALHEQPEDCENILLEDLQGTKLKGGVIQNIRVQDGNVLISRSKGSKKVDEWLDTWKDRGSILEQIRSHPALSQIGSPAPDGHEVRFCGNRVEVWDGCIWVAPSDHRDGRYKETFGETGLLIPDEFDFDNRQNRFLTAMRLYMEGREFADGWVGYGVAAGDDALHFRVARGRERMEFCVPAFEVRQFAGDVSFFEGFHKILAMKVEGPR